MKKFAVSIVALALVAPAFADDDTAAPNDTIAHMVANGAVVTAQGADYAMTYAEDGSFKDDSGMLAGTWKASGDQHCITVPGMFEDMCSAYPAGKTSGDTFEIETDMGPLQVKLN